MKDFTDLVYMKESFVIADSLGVAKRFNKQHKDVLRKIEAIVNSEDYKQRLVDGHSLNFVLKKKKQFMPNCGVRNDPYYEMDFAGFLILISEFTGNLAKSFRIKCFNEGFDVAWQWLVDKDCEKVIKDQLYVILYQNGMIKVGKGAKARFRIKTHSSNALVHSNPVVDYSIELEPKISENQLLDFCRRYCKNVFAREFFTDLRFEDVVRFMKYQKVPRTSIKVSMRSINSVLI